MSNINFLIANMIKFSSDIKITFSQRDAIKIKSKQFSECGSLTIKSICQDKVPECSCQVKSKWMI